MKEAIITLNNNFVKYNLDISTNGKSKQTKFVIVWI